MSHSSLWPYTVRIDPRANPARNAIAIYLLELEIPVPMAMLPHYLSYLGEAEGERWRAIRSTERQWQYLQSRLLRRVLLGAYTESDPAKLRFARDESGRTRLADFETLHFSLSLCASHVAMAVGSDAVLGIDVETIIPVRPSFPHIARDQFSASDLDQLRFCPSERRYSHFVELWTLKQAYRKALALGRHQSMANCTFSRNSAGLLECRDGAPPSGQELPTGFFSEQWGSSCHLSLAYRAGIPLSFRYLNGSGLTQAWPHKHHAPPWTGPASDAARQLS
jgi:4'-phosphopantetheinyl transferase